MKIYLVITVTCPDRSGIVEQLTDVIANRSGNWEESRMARLGGDFAGIVMVSVDEEKADSLTSDLLNLDRDEMSILVKQTKSPDASSQVEPTLYELHLTGADHEGIVHEVAAYLADQGVNLESMETKITPAPMSATPTFHMQAQLCIGSAQQLTKLAGQLQRMGDQMGADIEIRPREQ